MNQLYIYIYLLFFSFFFRIGHYKVLSRVLGGQFVGTICVCVCVCEPLQSCPVLCDFMDCSPSGSSVHGILQ